MKTFAVLRVMGAVLWVVASACASVYADEVQPVSDADTQRAAIEESRRTQTQRLDAMAKDCERKFAVTRCVDQVHAERLAIEGKLNRQEAALNDAQRLERGREQRERNREKAAAHAEKMANLAGKPPPEAKLPKLAAQPTGPARQSAPAIPKESAPSAQERGERAKDYQRKQADAVAKRAEVAKRLKDAGPPKPPLPKPD